MWNRIYGDDDTPFGASLAAAPAAVTGLQLSRNQGGTTVWPSGLPHVTVRGLDDYVAGHPENDLVMPLATFPVNEIAASCDLLGNVFAEADTDKQR